MAAERLSILSQLQRHVQHAVPRARLRLSILSQLQLSGCRDLLSIDEEKLTMTFNSFPVAAYKIERRKPFRASTRVFYLSILSQLQHAGILPLPVYTPPFPLPFQFFPSCSFLRFPALGILALVPFNSFPVAAVYKAQGIENPTKMAPFNSFPAAARRTPPRSRRRS